MNFTIALWNVFITGFGYYGVELCSDYSVGCFCHVSVSSEAKMFSASSV